MTIAPISVPVSVPEPMTTTPISESVSIPEPMPTVHDSITDSVHNEPVASTEAAFDDHETPSLEPDLTRDIFKQIWTRKAQERGGMGFQNTDAMDSEIGAGTSKKIRPTFANPNALKLSCELVRIFITESVQRAATVAEPEGGG
ncbi:hypothetical protein V6N12_066262 [Hibiscus sabdariffa]|uniref:Uncharacterized protein n=1 Tax=Hibiscus sabdariffa TaxID=183260 RepID=A0ABR1ZR74_9ROSI